MNKEMTSMKIAAIKLAVFALLLSVRACGPVYAAPTYPHAKAVSIAMACQQTARNWLASAYGVRLPLVPVIVVDVFPGHPDRLAEFRDGVISWGAKVTDCAIM